MDPPEGIELLENSWAVNNPMICKLKKSLYGLKQAPRLWYKHIDISLKALGFTSTNCYSNIYISNTKHIIILLYVDDLLLFSPSLPNLTIIKKHLADTYRMTDLGPVRQFLDIELSQIIEYSGLQYWTMYQQCFISTILSRFGMSACKGIATPLHKGNLLSKADQEYKPTLTAQQGYQKPIGSLMYLMMGTRPDLAYRVSTLSKFNCNPTTEHYIAAN